MSRPIMPILNRLQGVVEFLTSRHIPVCRVVFSPYRAQPVIEVGSSGRWEDLTWHRHAWGVDAGGHYTRYSTLLQGCQLTREVRHHG